ncbi:ScpA family protein [Rhodoluna sp.]|uniref:segregation and condensation protein A n=1 Tax=Rhodoluna sp. TaxID=1969481 RepID=UPI0025F3643C|nr:ScpA family protein [Rhodoluna sp.]
MVALLNQEATESLESAGGFAVSLGNFEGPFDLLLSLISKHEMDITEVSLSKVTDEFISYLKGLDDAEELDQASEFLVIAATLLDLKIAGLLPKGEVVDAEDVTLLEARDLLFAKLLQYRAFKEISSWFSTAISLESNRVARDVRIESRFRNQRPELVWSLSLDEFAKLAQETLTPREIPSVGLTHLHAPRVSIREQAAEVVSMLRKANSLTFRDLIGSVKDRAVVVARFLAVLELYRLAAISFEQDSPLGDLKLAWRAENFDDEKLATLGADYDS